VIGDEKQKFLSEKDIPKSELFNHEEDKIIEENEKKIEEKVENKEKENQKYKEEDIKKIMDFGFTREESINALEIANGNVEVAVGILFNE
jgi:NACalpha-BTF3-like transcription factor